MCRNVAVHEIRFTCVLENGRKSISSRRVIFLTCFGIETIDSLEVDI